MRVIYLITNVVNGLQYVGQTKAHMMGRYYTHFADAWGGKYCGSPLQEDMRRYGPEGFTVIQIDEADTGEMADELEVKHIAAHGTFHPGGYNLTTGGRVYQLCEYSRRKRAETKRKKPYVATVEDKIKISKGRRGQKLGPMSDKHKSNISVANEGIPKPEKHRHNMLEYHERKREFRALHGRWPIKGELKKQPQYVLYA